MEDYTAVGEIRLMIEADDFIRINTIPRVKLEWLIDKNDQKRTYRIDDNIDKKQAFSHKRIMKEKDAIYQKA